MLPLLKFVKDGKEHTIREAIDNISVYFKLTEEEKRKVLPSGQQSIIYNRTCWARTYLIKAGLLESPRRAHIKITDIGLKVLKNEPKKIDVQFLEQFPMFLNFRNASKEKDETEKLENSSEISQTPQELLENNYLKIKKVLAEDLLNLVKQNSPGFFEKLVIELLLAMGYGGSRKDAGEAIGQSRDGGIDGIIKEDKLGLDVIYIQAKRWENIVGSKEIRNFVGSLVGQKANKGIFITTSNFTKDALEYVKTITHKVILIDGEMLTHLKIEHNIGVSKVISYDIKKIDTDYFIED